MWEPSKISTCLHSIMMLIVNYHVTDFAQFRSQHELGCQRLLSARNEEREADQKLGGDAVRAEKGVRDSGGVRPLRGGARHDGRAAGRRNEDRLQLCQRGRQSEHVPGEGLHREKLRIGQVVCFTCLSSRAFYHAFVFRVSN